MKSILKRIEENTEQFETLLLEFITINTQDIAENIKKRKITKMFVSSHEVNVIAQLCGYKEQQPYYEIEASGFEKLCEVAGGLTVNQLIKKYPLLHQTEAETLNHTLVLYLKLLSDTGVERFILTPMSIGDAILDFEFQVLKNQRLLEWIELGSYASAKAIGQKYHTSYKHAEFVERMGLRIFDSLKKNHQLQKRQRQLLSLICYLMEVGSFIDHKNFWVQSRYIIETTDLIGVTHAERVLMGKVVESLQSHFLMTEDMLYESNGEEQLVVAKLAAILKIAVALDKSYQQKIQSLSCHFKNDKLVIEVRTRKNIQLEEYFFKTSRYTMEKVYGIKPILKIKRIDT